MIAWFGWVLDAWYYIKEHFILLSQHKQNILIHTEDGVIILVRPVRGNYVVIMKNPDGTDFIIKHGKL